MTKFALATALQMAVASQMYDDIFSVPFTSKGNDGKLPNKKLIKLNIQNRELKEFLVKGEVIMAYSKKDAIKRLNHQKRKTK